ncbi:MAG: hypothetical protein WAN59_04175 [Candidatus Baltobacteraceae bacterium]|jgi:hypothetical protein
MPRDLQRSLALDTLCDFVGGASLAEIARRYRLSPEAAEEQLRRGLFDHGFSAPARTIEPERIRRTEIVRASA